MTRSMRYECLFLAVAFGSAGIAHAELIPQVAGPLEASESESHNSKTASTAELMPKRNRSGGVCVVRIISAPNLTESYDGWFPADVFAALTIETFDPATDMRTSLRQKVPLGKVEDRHDLRKVIEAFDANIANPTATFAITGIRPCGSDVGLFAPNGYAFSAGGNDATGIFWPVFGGTGDNVRTEGKP